MIRRTLATLAIVSLLFCSATSIFWFRSYRTGGDQSWITTDSGGDKLLLASDAGTLAIYGPPPPGPGDATVCALTRQLRNNRIVLGPAFPGDEMGPYAVSAMTCQYYAGRPSMASLSQADIIRPLVDLLDEPESFVAAHAILCRRNRILWGTTGLTWQDLKDDDHEVPYLANLCGLRIAHVWSDEFHPVWADPAQIPELRSYWYRTLGENRSTFPHRSAVAVFAIAPAAWLAAVAYRRHRGRQRRQKHLCSACSYDLRATPERCPECGQIAEVAVTRAAGMAGGMISGGTPTDGRAVEVDQPRRCC